MFVLSVKSSFLKKAAVILSATAILTVAVVLCVNATKASPASKNDGVVLKAATHNERISFLSQFGWQINEDPLEVTEVLIPAEFDETYTKYNQLQKDENGLTSKEAIYAGGDAVTGSATVILAMGAGKTAANAIDDYIQSKKRAFD